MRAFTTTQVRRLLRVSAAATIVTGLAVAPAAAQLDSFFDKMKGMFGSSSSPQSQSAPAQATNAAPQGDLPCPSVDIRNGASTLTIYGAGDEIATNVRYQATFAQTARECVTLGTTMTVKLGVRGRIILGPLGGPGQVNVPIRIALVKEGPEPKTLLSKLHMTTVDLPSGDSNVPFTYVDQELTFPVASRDDMESYIFYVGFDEQGMKQQKPARKKRTRKSAD